MEPKTKLKWPNPISVVKNLLIVLLFTIVFTGLFFLVDLLGTSIQSLFI